MSFDDLLKDVIALGVLPEAAHLDFPSALAEDTKKKLCCRNEKKVAEIVADVIAEINHGSVETIDNLVRRKL